jgi:hypothetical protein
MCKQVFENKFVGILLFQPSSDPRAQTFRKDPDGIDYMSVQHTFQRYGITFLEFKEFRRLKFPQSDEEDVLHTWLLDQEQPCAELWERMTDEVFHLLFGNRGFLLEFNLGVASYRKKLGDPPSSRCAIPQWVKKAVYFRENGKCALCKKIFPALLQLIQDNITTTWSR